MAPAAIFYFGYPAGILVLALLPRPPSIGAAAAKSGLVGFTAYAVYDLSNLATLKNWSGKLTLADIAWGTLISVAAGVAAFVVMRWVEDS